MKNLDISNLLKAAAEIEAGKKRLILNPEDAKPLHPPHLYAGVKIIENEAVPKGTAYIIASETEIEEAKKLKDIET